ncbi:hypothetical protein [Pseudomonas orientalis]|uniref:hypothetical protein n=1 Tax=Pseudomonas orientalis TaxID=76758 RepID=UPI000F580892|nr:hypothetical protein [Pseudomonas orientalis]AZE89568.1 hypothetical protein C4J97_2869 [Pseudomonas orientalis]
MSANDMYILALKHAETKAYFTLGDLVETLKLSKLQEQVLALQIDRREIFMHSEVAYYNHSKRNDINLFFTISDKFRLLNHIELEEARASARSASRYATYALSISVVAAIISSLLSLTQLFSNISLPDHTIAVMDDIKEAAYSTDENVKTLSDLAKATLEPQQIYIIQSEFPYFPIQDTYIVKP